jgi:hypothetical protein
MCYVASRTANYTIVMAWETITLKPPTSGAGFIYDDILIRATMTLLLV